MHICNSNSNERCGAAASARARTLFASFVEYATYTAAPAVAPVIMFSSTCAYAIAIGGSMPEKRFAMQNLHAHPHQNTPSAWRIAAAAPPTCAL